MPTDAVRLNKFLATCGIGSRRHCDALVQDGQVTVNGEPCPNPATRIGPDDSVRLNGKLVRPKLTTTLLFYKPRGYVTTKDDEFGRDTIYKLLPPKYEHLNHVGRLDLDSEGLLVLTNDGDLAQRLSHPRNKTEKEYLVTLASNFDNEILDQFLRGVHTPSGKARAKAIRRLSPRRIAMVLETGIKRQIREMCKALHLRVTRLVRVRIGTLMDPALPSGRYRPLDPPEIEFLLRNPEPRKAEGDTRSSPRKQAKKRHSPARTRKDRKKHPAARKTARRPAAKHASKRVTKRA